MTGGGGVPRVLECFKHGLNGSSHLVIEMAWSFQCVWSLASEISYLMRGKEGVATMGNKRPLFVTLELKRTGASFSPSSIDSLCLRVAGCLGCRDLAFCADDRLAAHAHTRGTVVTNKNVYGHVACTKPDPYRMGEVRINLIADCGCLSKLLDHPCILPNHSVVEITTVVEFKLLATYHNYQIYSDRNFLISFIIMIAPRGHVMDANPQLLELDACKASDLV
jgi:hypothetical protein